MKPLLCVRHEPEDDGGLALDTFQVCGLSCVRGEDGSVQMFRHGDRAWGAVFHPEVTRNEVRRWLEGSDRSSLAERWGVDPDQLERDVERHLPEHEARGRELFRRFAGIIRASGLG